MAYKVIGVDTITSLFPPRVMTALKNIFAIKSDVEPAGLSSATKAYLANQYGGGQSSGGSTTAIILTQNTSATSWSFPHTVGRLPIVAVYNSSGVMVHPDIQATSSSLTLTFATATAGSVILL